MKKRFMAFAVVFCVLAEGLSYGGTAKAQDTKTGDTLAGEYVAIVNTNPDPAKKQSTGTITFNPNGASVDSMKPAEAEALMLEDGTVFAEEEIEAGTQKTLKKSFKNLRTLTTYQIGVAKQFYLNKNYICIGIGQECYIWMEETMYNGYKAAGKVEKAATEMKFVYEGEPFKMLQTMSDNKMYFADNSGKLSILLEDTGGSSGFYAGEQGITAIHINTPEANRYSGGQFAGKNGLLVHEGQHALFRDSTCDHDGSIAHQYSWLNEGLAVTAMDYTWGGADPNGWMTYINDNTEIRNGAPLVYSSYRGRTALDYGMQYAFVRYLSNRLAGGVYNPMPFFHAVYETKGAEKTAKTFVEGIIRKYHEQNSSSPTPTFEEVLTDYYVAMVAFDPSGPHGFGNDRIPAAKITDYPIYMGESGKSIDLAGTGAIIVKTVNGQFKQPTDAGADIRFVAFDKGEKAKPKGEGTKASPYLINTAEDVSFLSDYSFAEFRVEKDIDMSKDTGVYMPVNKFSGTLNGNGHQISKLTTALIATNEGTIKDLSVEVALTDEYLGDVGFLVDQNKGYIQGCTAKGSIKSRLIGGNMVLPNNFGAIAGATAMASTIRECYGEVEAELNLSTNHARIGALIGENQGNVYDSYAKGSITVNQNVTDRSLYVGGAIGSLFCRMSPAPYIHNIYSTTAITVKGAAADQVVGSLIGNIKGSTTPTIEYSYGLKDMQVAGGKVLGNGTENQNQVCGKSQEDLEKQSTYEKWNFGGVWKMPTGGTPQFTGVSDIDDITPAINYKEYFVGEKLNLFGSTLKIGNSSIPMIDEMLTGFDSSTAGTKTVKGVYKGKEFSFEVQVKTPQMVTNLFLHKGAKDTYVEGETFDPKGVVLRATLDGFTNRYIYSGYQADKDKGLAPNDTRVTYTYGNATVVQTIQVEGKKISSLKLIQAPKESVYQEKDTVKLEGAVFQVQYNDGTVSAIFNASQGNIGKIKWGISDGTDEQNFAIETPLKFADHGKMLYAYCEENQSAKVVVMTLNVKATMTLDDEVFVAAVGAAEYPFSKGIVGGSGNYSSRLKDGYTLDNTGVKVEMTPGLNGAAGFRFEMKSDKAGTVVLPYIITDTATGATIEVNMTFIFQNPSTDCSVLKVDVSEGFGQTAFGGVIDESAKKIKITIPSTITKQNLVYSNPIFSSGATSSPVNGASLYDPQGELKNLVVTAQDGTTTQTYQIILTQAPQTATKLTKAQNLTWDGNVAKWGKVENATGYLVYLYTMENDSLSAEAVGYRTTNLQYDFTKDLKVSDTYVFRVIALGDGMSFVDGPAATSSEYAYKRAPEVTNILVEPNEAEVYRGQSKKFNAIVSGVSSPNKSVTWSVENAVSSSTNISKEGQLTVGEDESASSLKIVAESVQTSGVQGEAKVTVATMPPIASPKNLSWEWVSDDTTGVATKAMAKWSAVLGVNGYRITLLKDNIPIGDEVGNDIIVNALTPQYDFKDRLMGAGTYSFRVAAIGNGTTNSDSVVVVSQGQVYQPSLSVTGVSVSPEAVTVKRGGAQVFTAAVQGADSIPQKVRWVVSGTENAKTSIAKQDDTKGKLTIAADESAETITVKAISVQDSSKLAEAVVTIDDRTQLGKPQTLTWDWAEQDAAVTKALAKWDAVTDAVGYRVTLLRDGVPVNGLIGIELDSKTTSYEFKDSIMQSGTYKFAVTALGDGNTSRNSEAAIIAEGQAYQLPTVTGVVVEPATATVKQGATKSFTATVQGTQQPSQKVVWSIVADVAEGTKITQTGQLTVAAKESSKAITVKATSVQDSSRFGTAVVTIVEMDQLTTPVNLEWEWTKDATEFVTKALAQWDAVTGAVGYRVTLLKFTQPSSEGAVVKEVEVQDSAVPYDFATNITASGSYAFRVVAIGNGTTHQDSNQAASTVYSYEQPPKVTEVVVTPGTADVEKGGTCQFSASVNGTDNPSQNVTWSIADQNADDTTIDTSGQLTVGKGEQARTIRVTATSQYDSTQSDSATVTIKTPAPVVTSVTVTPSNATVQQGKTQQFTATVSGDFEPSQVVIWSIVEAVAEGTTISKTGVLTVAWNERNSDITVKAVSQENQAQSETATVTITDLPQLLTPSTLKWDQGIASWDEVTDAVTYEVELYKDGGKLGEKISTTNLNYDFTKRIVVTGSYTFKLVAIGNHTDQADSAQATSSAYSYTAPAKVTGVLVTPQAPIAVRVGKGQLFNALVTGSDSPPATVQWKVSGQQSQSTLIDGQGQLSVGEDETAASVTVTAISTYDTGQSGSVVVTITPKPGPVESLKESIHALPEPDQVKDQDAAVIGRVKAAYDKLTKAEKKQLTDSERGKLSQVIGALSHIELLVTWDGLAAKNQAAAENLGLIISAEEITNIKKVIVSLDVKKVEKASDEAILSTLASENKLEVGSLYTIFLHKQIAGGKPQSITDTESVRITLAIPEEIRGKTSYAILRAHDKQGEIVASQASANEIVFRSGLFSTYAIAYGKEEKVPEKPPVTPPDNPSMNPTTNQSTNSPGGAAGGPATSALTAKKSGDDMGSTLYLLLLAVSGIIIGGGFIVGRKKRKNQLRNS